MVREPPVENRWSRVVVLKKEVGDQMGKRPTLDYVKRPVETAVMDYFIPAPIHGCVVTHVQCDIKDSYRLPCFSLVQLYHGQVAET